MASFIPNFNAPSQNYGNILNMSYRRGMDPRKRRRIASGRPAGTQVITNPDGTQVSVSGQTARQMSNEARREARAKRVAEVAAGQKRTKPSDLLLSPEEMRMRDRAGAMKAIRSMMDRGVAPSSWEGSVTPQTSLPEAPKSQKTREPLKRAQVKFDPSWEAAQGRGLKPTINPNPNAPGSPLVTTPDQQFVNTRRQRQNEAMARKVNQDLETFKERSLAQKYGTQYLDPNTQFQYIRDFPFPRQSQGVLMGGSPQVNELAARMAMSPEDRRYLDEQDRQRQMAGLLYSAPTGIYNYLFGD